MLLSVIIISHNQRSELRRCVDSVLAQDIPFEYEIILSDDRSTDGTFELAQEYAAKYPFITASQCNSDECKPFMTLERAGFNRVNGLKFAKGKYVVHVDGDDFYIGNDCFRRQVEMLEKHPECNICCQRYIFRNEGESIEKADHLFTNEMFNNRLISIEEFVRTIPYIHNSACCMRRSALGDKIPKFYQYDDVDITYQYIGDGKVALIDACGFVYTRYDQGTASHFGKNDQIVLWTTAVFNSLIAPQCIGALFRNNLDDINNQINYSLANVRLENNTLGFLSRFDVFVFNSFRVDSCLKKVRLRLSKLLIKIIKMGIDADWIYKMLYGVVVKFKMPNNANFSRMI